jgi:predicted DNA-binding mobile mystery protein A
MNDSGGVGSAGHDLRGWPEIQLKSVFKLFTCDKYQLISCFQLSKDFRTDPMTPKTSMSIQQLEDSLRPFRSVAGVAKPTGGWIRAIREALGMTNKQFAKRVQRQPQTALDLQKREAAQTIQLNTLRELAEALDCELVYAIVPRKSLDQMLDERAEVLARHALRRTGHSMELERQGLGVKERERAFEREVERLLSGSRRKLWE